MRLESFLFDLVTRIEFLELYRDEVLLNISVIVLITDVISK